MINTVSIGSQGANMSIQNPMLVVPQQQAVSQFQYPQYNNSQPVAQPIGIVSNNVVNIKDLDNIFKKLEGLEGKDFASTAYAELVKHFGLEKSAPQSITWKKNEGRPIVGDYAFYNNSVVFYEDYFLKMSKPEQIGVIAHELTHCKQLVNMLTTEGLSLPKIASAYATSDFRAMLTKNPNMYIAYKNAVSQGKGRQFVEAFISEGTKRTTKELLKYHANTLRLPKHPINSPEGIKAQKDLIDQFNYNGADLRAYNESIMEKEAMSVENMVKIAYKTYNRVSKNQG